MSLRVAAEATTALRAKGLFGSWGLRRSARIARCYVCNNFVDAERRKQVTFPASAAATACRAAASVAASPVKAHEVVVGAGPLGSVASEPLRCTTTCNVGKFAGAVAKRIKSDSHCDIHAVGPLPSHNAIKAIVLANSYLKDFLKDEQLAVRFSKASVRRTAPSGRPTETLFMHLQVWPVPMLPTAAPEFFVRGDSNPGELAGLVKREIQDNGTITLAAMGERALDKVSKSLVISETYLAQTLEGRVLVAAPRMERFTDSSEEKHRLVLCCILTSAPAANLVASPL